MKKIPKSATVSILPDGESTLMVLDFKKNPKCHGHKHSMKIVAIKYGVMWSQEFVKDPKTGKKVGSRMTFSYVDTTPKKE